MCVESVRVHYCGVTDNAADYADQEIIPGRNTSCLNFIMWTNASKKSWRNLEKYSVVGCIPDGPRRVALCFSLCIPRLESSPGR